MPSGLELFFFLFFSSCFISFQICMTSGWPHFGPRRYPLPEGRVLSVRGTEGRQINMHSLMHIRSRSYAMLSLPFLEGSGVGEGVEEGGENKSPLLVCAMCWKPDAGPGTKWERRSWAGSLHVRTARSRSGVIKTRPGKETISLSWVATDARC